MRRRGWIAATLGLLLLSAWLSSLADSRPATTARAPVQFPTSARRAEYDRMRARRTLAVPTAVVAAAAGDEEPEKRKRDPFLAALPARADDPVLVFEANALRHSRLGELFVRCMLAKDPKAFEKAEQQIGIDVLKDVDRVAFVGQAVVVSGFFKGLRTEQLQHETGAPPERYGESGILYAPDAGPASEHTVVGTWRDQLVVFAGEASTVRRAFDQLEGRAPPATIDLPDEIAYGEAYGVIPGEAVRRLLRNDSGLLADRLAAAASRIELHVDAMQDIAAVARFRGADAAALSDLGRAMGGVLAGARLHAQVSGDKVLADLLDQASVVPGDGRFSVQVALPMDRVEAWFADCGR